MKKWSLLLLTLLIPGMISFAEEEVATLEEIDILDGLASIDDLCEILEGTLTKEEETLIYTYEIKDLKLVIDLNQGYSLVNEERVPYLLEPSDLDPNVMNIVYFIPQLHQEELFVPIQFIERVFNLTYNDGIFILNPNLVDSETDTIEEEEEDVKKTVVNTPSSQEDEKFEQNEENSNNKPSTSTPNTSKPNTSTPITPKPDTNPDESIPDTTPDESIPDTTPDESIPDTTPDEPIPDTNPDESIPDTNPDESIPDTNPDESIPDTNPDESIPDTNPDESIPDTTPDESITE